MTVRICFGLLLSFFWAGEVLAEDAVSWLDRMSHSFRELTYRGTLSYQRGDDIQSLRIAHTVIGGEEFERLDYLDGDQREVVRRDHSLTCIHPGHKLVRFFAPAAADIAADQSPTKVSASYNIAVEGHGRLAGRDVVNLTISPRDAFRYGYRLALDQASGLMVRSELLTHTGDVLERFQFVEVEIGGDIPQAYFDHADHAFYPHHGKQELPESSNEPEQGTLDWSVSWKPQGFILAQDGIGHTRRQMLTYTDGMTVFSVFLDEVSDQGSKATEGSSTRGATSAYFRILQLAGRPHRVTVVGEIPVSTAQQIARSVTLVAAR